MKRFVALLLVLAMSTTLCAGAFAAPSPLGVSARGAVLYATGQNEDTLNEGTELLTEEHLEEPKDQKDKETDKDSGNENEGSDDTQSSEDPSETDPPDENDDNNENDEPSNTPESGDIGAAFTQKAPVVDTGTDIVQQPENNDSNKEPSDVTPRMRVIIREGSQSVKEGTSFDVSLQKMGAAERNKSETVKIGGFADFEDLTAGEYTLQIKFNRYMNFTQTVQVDSWDITLEFYTGILSNITYQKNTPHPGVLLCGDWNNDGFLSKEDDVNALVSLLEEDSSEASLSDLDMLIEALQIQTGGYDFNASPVRTVPAAGVQAVTLEGTDIKEGTPQDLAVGSGAVTLARADGDSISSEKPVEIEFSLDHAMQGIVIHTPQDAPIVEGSVVVEYEENGKRHTATIPIADSVHFLLENDAISERDAVHAIRIDLGSQIAVKKVTIRITKTQKDAKLAEITAVEFLNDMEDRIPAPATDIPQKVQGTPQDAQFIVSWNHCANVTGYEVEIACNGKTDTRRVKANTLLVSSFNNDKIVNNTDYTVRVRSTNGDWKSSYSDSVTVTPVPSKRPDAPDNLRAVGAYRSIQVSWKNMKNTDSYNLFYRKKGDTQYTKITNIKGSSYKITNLEDQQTYELYVTGVNDLGESRPSLTASATTTNVDAAQMPQYGLINKTPAGSEGAAIVGVTTREGGMVASALDTAGGTALGTADKDASSYYEFATWDSGGYNAMGSHGVTWEFDKPYKIQTLALSEPVPQSPQYGYARVAWTDENGKQTVEQVSIQRRLDSNGRAYYWLRLAQPVTTSKLRIALARSVANGTITISEVCFYHYDSLEDDIFALYTDDLHTVLRDDVTQETIDTLRARLETPDESGECHPDAAVLEKELKTAEEILALGKTLAQPVTVHNTITTSDVNRGFSGLNAWQPLGVTAAAGETIVVYVGHSSKKTGDSTNLQLIATQYHAESSGVASTVCTLKVGRNEITVPQISTLAYERGGALYVQYTGKEADTGKYAVRVSGGVQVPILDLYRVEDRAERLTRAAAYIKALDTYCADMSAAHNSFHSGAGSAVQAPASVQYAYDAQNCILGASDVLLETMLVSLPAQQILAGVGSGTAEERANRLVDSMDAMEGMMDLFYQHKGLNPKAENVVDQYPRGHLNIRYQRMFAGAFMYAAGNHIGIEWGSAPGMFTSAPVQSENGKYVSGRYFGWGIAHEIGHCINQGSYAVAEITNNYFALLAQSHDTNDSVRLNSHYPNIYKKVTSGETGRASSVFVQLGLYWQLHLAYDNCWNFKTYENHSEQLNNLFFARVDRYARTPASAPKPGGAALTLSGGTDQVLMRLSCAAAEKDLLEFFERWGMIPDEGTKQYAQQFTKETRAIYYGTDDARAYRLTHTGGGHLKADGTTAGVGTNSTAKIDANAANTVVLTLSSLLPEGELLGFEVVRCTTEGGKVEREPVGFATSSIFRDCVTTMNNRVVFYEVTAIDKFLNRSAVMTLPLVKIQHDKYVDKASFTAETENLKALKGDASKDATEDDPCEPKVESAIRLAVDNKNATVFEGVVEGEGAAVTIEFGRPLAIEGFSYTSGGQNAVGQYSIRVRDESGSWMEAASGSFTDAEGGDVYFGRKGNIASYTTTAVQFAILDASGTTVHIAELDVLGVTGDNVEWKRTETNDPAVGKLSEDYVYGDKQGDVIPKGSIVFTGSYKGNPAYNVVMLYDQNGNVIGSTEADGTLNAQQIILAEVPAEGKLRDVADGIWIYWVAPDTDLSSIQQVRAELYRVDNAQTNEGQRLVSDSLPIEMPSTLPSLTLGGGGR